MATSLQNIREKIAALEVRKNAIITDIMTKKVTLSDIEGELYIVRNKEIHYAEIYRLARLHFNRLRNFRESIDLTVADIRELEKWIDRAKTSDGLKAIVEALSELKKYLPNDIKSNLYALVQKIIIGGAYGKK